MESLLSYHRLIPHNFSLKGGEELTPLEARSKRAADAKRVLPLTGFTLIEMMVVLAIIVTITGVTLTSQSTFNQTLTLANTAYDIALTLRSAQTYGVSSRGVSSLVGVGYGLHFDRTSPASFTFFSDGSTPPDPTKCHGRPPAGVNAPDAKRGNCVYDPNPPPGEKISDYNLGNTITITDFCARSALNTWECATSQGEDLSSLDIVFVRPDPSPFIYINGRTDPAGKRTKACLVVSSSSGGPSRFISISSSGAITANDLSCPTP